MKNILTKEDPRWEFLSSRGVDKDLIVRLNDMGFFSAPASSTHHLSYTGGLFDHSVNVYMQLEGLTRDLSLSWEREESPFVVGMFHDLCKCDNYKLQGGIWLKDDPIIKGHGSKSVILLSSLMRLTEEEAYCIRFHMGAYETEDWDSYSKAIKKYPNVLWTHTADMIASQIKEVGD